MKKLWNRLFKRPKMVYLNTDDLKHDPVLVVQTLQEIDPLHKALGITDERADQINQWVIEAVHATKRTTDAMHQVSKKLVHVNEVYMAAIMMHSFLDKMRKTNVMMNLLSGALGDDND